MSICLFNWGLPSSVSYAPNAYSSVLDHDASDMMKNVGFKYPPLQFLIYDFFLPDECEADYSISEIIEMRSQNQIIMRIVNSVMTLLTSFLIYLFTLIIYDSLSGAVTASLLFLLNPLSYFFSESVNMDQPYLFWFVLSFFILFCSEYYKKMMSSKIYWYLQGGFALTVAFAFCTKDQVYSLYILPVLYYIFCEYRRKEPLSNIVKKVFLWAAVFAAVCILIYIPAGGKQMFLTHFYWIMHGGVEPFESYDYSIIGIILLFIKYLKDTLTAFDWPLTFFTVSALILSFFIKNRKSSFCRYTNKILFYIFLLYLSNFIFFILVIKFSYPRFLISIIPFVCIYSAGVFTCERRQIKFSAALILSVIFFQGIIAFQLADSMKNSARVKIRNYTNQIYADDSDSLIAVCALEYLNYYSLREKQIKKLKGYRKVFSLGNYIPGSINIYPEISALFMLKPDYIVISDKAADPEIKDLFEKNFYLLKKRIKDEKNFIFSFYRYRSGNFSVYVKSEDEVLKERDFRRVFKSLTLERQVQILKEYAAVDSAMSLRNRLKLIKYQYQALAPLLKKFNELDENRYFIKPGSEALAGLFYYSEDSRIADAAEAFAASLMNDSKGKYRKWSENFFRKHPEFLEKYNFQMKNKQN